jgi:hypothetical protein
VIRHSLSTVKTPSAMLSRMMWVCCSNEEGMRCFLV